jgi:hypothetical protein
MQDLLKALQPPSGIKNKGHGISCGNHDLEWMNDKHDRYYGTAY